MRLRWTVIGALALACLTNTGVANGYLTRGRQLTSIELKGSNGYSAQIVVDRNQHLTLTTTKEAFTTEYLSHDTLPDPNLVKATLKGFGKISVRFHPRGPARRAPAFAGCNGPRPRVRTGIVRGVIDFSGERDYTRLEAREAPAEIEEWKRQICRPGTGPEFGNFDQTDWISKFSAGFSFIARKYRPGVLEGGNQVLYSAETDEEPSTPGGPILIVRRASVEAPATAFDAHPEHMVIAPPPPFTGAGTFARTPESVFTWTGDLSIQFPGRDALSLAGPEFETNYCRRNVGCFHQHIEPPDGAFSLWRSRLHSKPRARP